MQGVRDQVHVAQRMGAVPEMTVFAEEDMADMFWEIPADEIIQAARWAMRRMCTKQCIKQAFFSISRESKHLDRVGTSAAQRFLVVDAAAIMRFLDFDLGQNVLFTAGGVVLAQGGKGVPIGGFIPAQARNCGLCGGDVICLTPLQQGLARWLGSRLLMTPPVLGASFAPPTSLHAPQPRWFSQGPATGLWPPMWPRLCYTTGCS